ncbi:MAG: hypothetical protein A4S09_02480 [Proteobacteria bacterium SG_bin7]|nr:MAG: hypothetical protein A4S09_02480 [Proteobacteria bacterium SG_bin7]
MFHSFRQKLSSPNTLTVMVLFFAHWLILLNDGVYYDGILVQSWRNLHPFSFLNQWFWDVGKPLLSLIYFPVLYFSNWIFISKLVNFICLFFTSYLIRRILEHSKLFSPRDALAISLLALSYSGIQMAAEMAALQYYLLFPVYLFGFFLYQISFDKYKSAKLRLQIAGGVVCFAGFFTSSLLPLHYFFTALLAYELKLKRNWNFTRLIFELKYVLVLPVVFWITRGVLFPPNEIYKKYYFIDLNWQSIKDGYLSLINLPVMGEFLNSLSPYSSAFISVLSIVALTLLFYFLQDSSESSEKSKLSPFLILLSGIIVLLLGSFPYIAIRQYFDQFGWSTKNNVLVGTGMGLLLFGIIGLITLPKPLSKYRYSLMATFVVLFSLNANKNFVDLQLGSIKHNAFISEASKNSSFQSGSLFELKDEFYIPRLPNLYYSHNIAYVFYLATNDLKRNGKILEKDETPKFVDPQEAHKIISGHAPILATPDVNVKGRQYYINIKRRDNRPESNIVYEYFKLKFLSPERLEKFYSNLMDIHIREILPTGLSIIENSGRNTTNN